MIKFFHQIHFTKERSLFFLWDRRSPYLFRERYPILWDGHLARPCIVLSAGKMPTPQEILGYFFYWKSPIIKNNFIKTPTHRIK
ncbi:hypothetical protein [Dolichospermum flos-aquae]|jgi:hypothetical protein|uniref:Uncharacterized protein n=1 Tax=Dolichospermum flos-aquae CCAP 1403/13F TaxID=315271 RepID=A0A6H2BZB3_DOLFA|nr:hypothetical protein [Dolichospermum flos-aquae]QJB44587.1 hypothetical protein HGD76_10775 [Dolichospermum flos-aquae CCAP 1403/13F]